MQQSIPCSSGSVFVTGRMAVIHFLKGSVFILIGEFALATHVYFQKMLVPTMRPFKGTTIIYTEYSEPSTVSTVLYIVFTDVKVCSHSVLSTPLLSAYFRTPVTVKQISYQSSCIFWAASIISKWEQPLEAYIFSQNHFFQNTYLSGVATSS